MKQKEWRGAEKGSKLWKPTHSSVHISCGRYRQTEEIPVTLLRNHVAAW